MELVGSGDEHAAPEAGDARFDEQGPLHCDDNFAVCFRDGWGFYFLHGVATPNNFVKASADDLKLEEILAIENSEARRAVLGKFGFARLLKTVKPRVISQAGEHHLIQFKVKEGSR